MRRVGGLTVVKSLSTGQVTLGRRSDYIGTEVDRFFRLTGKSQPGCVMIGQNLAPHLELEHIQNSAQEHEPGWGVHFLRVNSRSGNSAVLHNEILATCLFPFGDLRGLKEPYAGMLCKDRYSYLERERAYTAAADRLGKS